MVLKTKLDGKIEQVFTQNGLVYVRRNSTSGEECIFNLPQVAALESLPTTSNKTETTHKRKPSNEVSEPSGTTNSNKKIFKLAGQKVQYGSTSNPFSRRTAKSTTPNVESPKAGLIANYFSKKSVEDVIGSSETATETATDSIGDCDVN